MSLDKFDTAAAKLTTAQTFAQAFYGPTDQRPPSRVPNIKGSDYVNGVRLR